MKLSNIIALSAGFLFSHQVLATVSSLTNPGEEVSMATNTVIPQESMMIDTPASVDAPASVETNALESDLMKHLGWSKKDSQVLTGFLNAIDQISTIVGEKAQRHLDQPTLDMLAEFQLGASQLMADAGYEYREVANHHRVLTRIRQDYHPAAFSDVIEKLVMGLTGLLEKLKRAARGNDVLTKVLNLVTNILHSLGRYLEKLLTPK
ncbi:hypothetical protein BC941DRAFT_466525 [Chlamydoabsidia padenii]|nr:hypothetical protein BC941DRAFT_466525 [Chlamydoabsidia padenii]